MMCITGSTVTHDLTIDLGMTCFGMFIFLQDQDAGTFSHDKAVTFFVKRNAGAVFVIAFAQSSHGLKSGNCQRRNGCLASAGHDDIFITVADLMESLADGIAAGCARRNDTGTMSLCPDINSNCSGCQIGKRHRNEERRYSSRTPCFQIDLCLFDRCYAADSRSDNDTEAIHIFCFRIDFTVFHRLFCRNAGKLRKTVVELQVTLAEVALHIQIFYFSCKLYFIVACIEMGNFIDTASFFTNALPHFIYCITDGRYCTHACDHYSAFHNRTSYIDIPPST